MEKVKSVLLCSPCVPETQEYSRATFRSLRRYTDYPKYTLLWAANKQTVESINYLQTYCADADVVIDSVAGDRGCGGGWNAGINYAMENGYDYVLLFTNDTLFSHGWLTSLVEHAEAHPECGIISPIWHWTGKPTCGMLDDEAMAAWNDTFSLAANVYAETNKGIVTPGMQGCFFMMSTDFIRQLEVDENKHGEAIPGRSDTASFPVAYWEDADLLMRAWRAGKKPRVYHGSALHHFGAATLADPRYHKVANELYNSNQINFSMKWNCADRLGVRFMCHNSIVAFGGDREILMPDGVHKVDKEIGAWLIERGY